jgi:hypothetical protein
VEGDNLNEEKEREETIFLGTTSAQESNISWDDNRGLFKPTIQMTYLQKHASTVWPYIAGPRPF